MKKTLISALLVLTFFVIAGCGSSAQRDFNHLLLELADADQTISHDDWMKIESFLDSQKTHFGDFYSGDQLKVEAVKEYIKDFFEHRRSPKTIAFIGVGAEYLKVNFFLERSGSMIAYDDPQGDGSFKAAIVKMLNNLPGNNADNKIYVVNDGVNAYPHGFAQFLADANIFEATKGIGDPSYTDFGAIFDQLLNKTDNNQLSILVTDMIYSTKNMVGVNPQKVFAEAQGMINAVFKANVKDKSMLIVKMNGSFDGPYYTYNSVVKQYHGRRPYYIVIVGNNDDIARLSEDSNYAAFSRFSELKGFENMYLFDTDGVYKPYYSLLLSNQDIRGRFQPERGQDTQIKNIEGMEVDRNSGDLQLALAVDLGGMFIDNAYLTNPVNYQVESDDPVVIKSIRAISSKDVTPAEKKYLGQATHIFILKMNKISNQQDVKIKLLNKLPDWVAASSNDDDTQVDSRTTFGLKYLLQGIYSSYQRNSDGAPYYFEMDLKFND